MNFSKMHDLARNVKIFGLKAKIQDPPDEICICGQKQHRIAYLEEEKNTGTKLLRSFFEIKKEKEKTKRISFFFYLYSCFTCFDMRF